MKKTKKKKSKGGWLGREHAGRLRVMRGRERGEPWGEYVLIWCSVSVRTGSRSNYERWPLRPLPLQTDESIVHPVMTTQSTLTPHECTSAHTYTHTHTHTFTHTLAQQPADSFQFKGKRRHKLDPTTRATGPQYQFRYVCCETPRLTEHCAQPNQTRSDRGALACLTFTRNYCKILR